MPSHRRKCAAFELPGLSLRVLRDHWQAHHWIQSQAAAAAAGEGDIPSRTLEGQ